MRGAKRKLIVHSTEEVDKDGVVNTRRKSVTIQVGKSDEFFMVFVHMIAPFFELKSATDMKVLIKFCQISEFNTGKVHLTPAVRKEVMLDIDVKTSHLSNSIARLKQVGLITGEQGSYMLSPIVAWKGDSKTRDQLIHERGLEFKLNFTSKQFE